MTDYPVTPPVPEDLLAALRSEMPAPLDASADLTPLQRLVQADKAAGVAAVLHAVVPLVGAFGLNLSGADVATLSSIVSVGLTYFVAIHFKQRAKPAA